MPNKFKISLKLTGLELQIEGSRGDVPLMAQAVGQQLTGMFMPAADVIEGEVVEQKMAALPAIAESTSKSNRKRPNRSKPRPTVGPKSNASADDKPIDWVHDPSKWGYPKQGWSTVTKAIWLLYVASKEVSVPELTARKIANTFNKHFRESGQIAVQNVARDLAKKKAATPAVVGSDTTKSPGTWYLTHTGISEAEKLVNEALGRTPPTTGV